jgi:hypothetical protein
VRPSRRREKLIRRDVFNTEISTSSYLKWSDVPITFDHKDHPDHVPQPGACPLVVVPLFKSKQIHKVLMDGESGINVLYASALDDMGIPLTGEARTNLNFDVSCANHLSPTHDRYKFTV